MTEPALKKRVRRLEDVKSFDDAADVVICGFGGAGASAAWEARMAGVDTLVLERASDGGGSTQMSSCEMYLGGSGGTELQKACGFEDSTENFIRYLELAMGAAGDKERIRIYAENAAEHFRWVEGLGIKYKRAFYAARDVVPLSDESLLHTGNERAWPYNEVSTPVPRGHVPSADGDFGGRIFMGTLMQTVRDLGARVMTDTRAHTLIQDDTGRVRGVVARIDNKDRVIEARRAVILTCGGFVMNEEMVAKHAPHYRTVGLPWGNPWDKGDGILMGVAAGGQAINMGEVFLSLAFYPPAKLTYGLFVNRNGQRFVNEDSYLARMAYYGFHQDAGDVYLVVQNEDWEPSLYLERAEVLAVGDSIADVEAEAGFPEGALQATIEIYNKFAANQEDPLFRKAKEWLKPIVKPPFAVVKYNFKDLKAPAGTETGLPMFTLGGLEVRPTGEVLTADGDAIPGLFAAGRTVAGLPRTCVGYASGMSVGDATFFGRLAGRTAASTNL
jgi:succinate dehydrogenase/fumarate reductase flavoprotein subunit